MESPCIKTKHRIQTQSIEHVTKLIMYIWFTFGGTKIDSKEVELILTCLVALSIIHFVSRIDSNLKLEIGASNYRIDFYTQIYCSTQFYINWCKHKPFYLHLNFSVCLVLQEKIWFWVNWLCKIDPG
jgi:hypothetical protein